MIPVSEPDIGDREKKYVRDCLESGWISSGGKYINEFEGQFSGYFKRKYGIAVNNGTNALWLAIRALELPTGSEIVLPSFTIISCALACIYNKLVPVFIDSERETWNMDPTKIAQKITKKTKAIMIVHIYGHPVNMDPILKIAEKNNLLIIEDFAEAIGTEYKNEKCGGFGIVSCASFYSNKVITTGEGGICLTDDSKIAERMRSLRNLCFLPDERFVHYHLGFNFRITNIQAAIGLAQLERIDNLVRKKRWIGSKYKELLKELEDKNIINLPVEKSWAKSTYWMFGIVLNRRLGIEAKEVGIKLAENGIQTRPFFYPLHQQPAFQKFAWFKKETLKVSENLYKYGFYIPSGLTLKQSTIKKVSTIVKKVIHGFC